MNSLLILLDWEYVALFVTLRLFTLTSFPLFSSLIKISSISFGKGSLIQHTFTFCSHPWSALLEVQNLLSNIFSIKMQDSSPFCYAMIILIGKVEEAKYQQFCFHSDICCNILQTEFHLHRFFAYSRYDIQILPVLWKGHLIYSKHF